MERKKGIGYCGLACSLCSHSDCPGCHADGCTERDWCKHLKCCREKGHEGCWQCEGFPCKGSMYDSNPRLRAFARIAKAYGADGLTEYLERNERAGIVYHYPGSLKGDYDEAKSEAEIVGMVLHGKGEAVPQEETGDGREALAD